MKRAPYVINELWAYIAMAPDGDEGIPGYVTETGHLVPLIAADPHRLFDLETLVLDMEKAHGQKFKLVRLATRQEVSDAEKARLMAEGRAAHEQESETRH